MAAEDLIPTLQTAVGSFNTTVDGKQTTIDTKVSSGTTARNNAQTARNNAETARDTAEQSLKAAYTDTHSAKSAVDYQDLAALAAEKAVTAVDVFVYDTSKDSDGGAWRKRCSKLSWYNEPLNTATRGSRREFPSVAVIVATAGDLIIYDGDDPSLPMWMVFKQNSFEVMFSNPRQSIFALNGIIAGGASPYDLIYVKFIEDAEYRYTSTGFQKFNGVISERNDALSRATLSSARIASRYVNDVAMTVLPDAPIDPATGLPVPTIAVATDGGVSVIKDDGTVYSFGGGLLTTALAISPDNQLLTVGRKASQRVASEFTDSTTLALESGDGGNSFTAIYRMSDRFGAATQIAYDYGGAVADTPDFIHGGFKRLSLVDIDPTLFDKSMVCDLRTTYNTGWMVGDIKGAFLADTDETDLVGGNIFTNSDFSTGDQTGWTTNSAWLVGTGDGSVDFSTVGQVTITEQNGADRSFSQRVLGSKPGDRIKITLNIANNTSAGNARVRIGYGSSSGSTSPYVNIQGTGVKTYYLTAAYNDQWLVFHVSYPNVTATLTSFEAEIVDHDRSVANKPLIVNGTITRTPVATGAELVAYSGFNASNYLEQPYNADLDFGTGDFCYMGWLTSGATPLSVMFSRGDGAQANVNDAVIGSLSAAGTLMYRHYNASGVLVTNVSGTANLALGTSVWKHFAIVRKDGVIKLYVDGLEDTLQVNTNPSGSVGGTTFPKFAVGKSIANVWPTNTWSTGGSASSLAFLRISATAPSPEQIKKIYEDERHLFQENAACTLYGTSDAVTALAYDKDTDLLHVGTSAGRSVFKGLRRVDNTTVAVGTAISASNGLVVEE